MTDDSGAPSAEEVEAARKLFAGPCDFIFASASAKDLPSPGAPEVAFAGRSNVGKSSLLKLIAGTIQADDGLIQREDGVACVVVEQDARFLR